MLNRLGDVIISNSMQLVCRESVSNCLAAWCQSSFVEHKKDPFKIIVCLQGDGTLEGAFMGKYHPGGVGESFRWFMGCEPTTKLWILKDLLLSLISTGSFSHWQKGLTMYTTRDSCILDTGFKSKVFFFHLGGHSEGAVSEDWWHQASNANWSALWKLPWSVEPASFLYSLSDFLSII